MSTTQPADEVHVFMGFVDEAIPQKVAFRHPATRRLEYFPFYCCAPYVATRKGWTILITAKEVIKDTVIGRSRIVTHTAEWSHSHANSR